MVPPGHWEAGQCSAFGTGDTLGEEQTVLLPHYLRPDLAGKGAGGLGGPLLSCWQVAW